MDLEMSAIIEIMAGEDIEPKPAVLFDDIPGVKGVWSHSEVAGDCL